MSSYRSLRNFEDIVDDNPGKNDYMPRTFKDSVILPTYNKISNEMMPLQMNSNIAGTQVGGSQRPKET